MVFIEKEKMIIRAFILLLLGLLFVNPSYSQVNKANGIDCSFFISGIKMPAHCQMNFMQANDAGHNIGLTGSIELEKAFAEFPKHISSALNKRSCRERVKVKNANIGISNNQIHANIRVWIEKRVCESFIRTRIFEKTGNVHVVFTPIVQSNEIRLSANVTDSGLSDFEEKLMGLIGINPREKIKSQLDGLLRLSFDDLKLPVGLKDSLNFQSLKFSESPPVALLEMSAKLNTETISELLNLWKSSKKDS